MKITKLAAAVIATMGLMTGISSAVSITVNGFANTSVGLIGLSGSTSTAGRAIFISTTADISSSLFSNLSPLLSAAEAGNPTSSVFNTALNTAIGTTSTTSVGIFRTFNFTNGTMSSLGSSEVGSIGNNTYLVLVAESGGVVQGFGAYTNSPVPSLGAVTFNPTNVGDGIGIGTSTLASGIGYQLAPVTVIPEPSAALLGALGALGLLRRRRI